MEETIRSLRDENARLKAELSLSKSKGAKEVANMLTLHEMDEVFREIDSRKERNPLFSEPIEKKSSPEYEESEGIVKYTMPQLLIIYGISKRFEKDVRNKEPRIYDDNLNRWVYPTYSEKEQRISFLESLKEFGLTEKETNSRKLYPPFLLCDNPKPSPHSFHRIGYFPNDGKSYYFFHETFQGMDR